MIWKKTSLQYVVEKTTSWMAKRLAFSYQRWIFYSLTQVSPEWVQAVWKLLNESKLSTGVVKKWLCRSWKLINQRKFLQNSPQSACCISNPVFSHSLGRQEPIAPQHGTIRYQGTVWIVSRHLTKLWNKTEGLASWLRQRVLDEITILSGVGMRCRRRRSKRMISGGKNETQRWTQTGVA